MYTRYLLNILLLALSLILASCGPSGSSSNTTSTNTTPTTTTPTTTPVNTGTVANVKFTTSTEAGIEATTFNGPTTVILDANESTKGVSYEWSVTKDGVNVQTASGMKTSIVLQNIGTYTVELLVTDAHANTGKATKVITVQSKVAPKFIAQQVIESYTVNVNASATTGATGIPDNAYSWEVQDSSGASVLTQATGITTTLPLLSAGRYAIVLTIMDNAGNTFTSKQYFNVEEKTVMRSSVVPKFKAEQLQNSYSVKVNARDTSGAVGVPDNSYLWDVQDSSGTNDVTQATGIETTLPLSTAGRYAIVLTVTDNDGNTSTSRQYFQVKEKNPLTASIAALTSTRGPAPLTVLLDGSGSVPMSNSSIAAFTWKSIDNTGNAVPTATARGARATLVFPGVGLYVVTLTVDDTSGQQATTQDQIKVEPTNRSTTGSNVEFTVTQLASALHTIILDANNSHMTNTITGYAWSATSTTGSVITSQGAVTTMGFSAAGIYVITLTITDSNGSLTSSQTVEVQ